MTIQILIISHDVVGTRMAGPGIRYYHLARVLSNEFQVTLAVPDEHAPDLPGVSFKIGQYTRKDWGSIRPLIEDAGVVIMPSDIASDFPQLAESKAPVVIDGYDPLLAEWLFLQQSLPIEEQYKHWQVRMGDLNQQYLIGDFFLCASARQRLWWLGLLEANGRINPYTLSNDTSLRSLIDVVAFGLPETPPKKTRHVIRNVWPGISETDKVILWGGGLWPWLDPLTAIRALIKVCKERKDVRLIFPGTKHPNPMLKDIQSHNKAATQMAEDAGLLGKAVFFGDWVPYEDWGNVLLECDIALSLHYDTLETQLAFRSRMLEYIWGGLPVIATKGDATSDLVEKYKLGIVVDYQDADNVSESVLNLLKSPREEYEAQFDTARHDLTWEKAALPLIEFCRNPHKAPDKEVLMNKLGNPSYVNDILNLKDSVSNLHDQVRRFEQSRVIRFRNWFEQIKRNVGL